MLGEALDLPKADYYEICKQALSQCATLKDRFCIFDVLDTDTNGGDFRNNIGINNLKYGAAYTPHLQTSLTYLYNDTDVDITGLPSLDSYVYDYEGIKITYAGSSQEAPKFRVNQSQGTGNTETGITFEVDGSQLTIRNVGDGVKPEDLVTAWKAFNDKGLFNIADISIEGDMVVGTKVFIELESTLIGNANLASIKGVKSALYSKIVNELAKQRIVLPPSAAVAGAYATTDRERGVWKAPANISLNAVIAPAYKISNADQENLNLDSDSGKSINAIRSFAGKGTLIWGARTLAGNDNEWRYVPVRRLFNMIEESTKKASSFAVFEPNSAATWLKVKAMIDSYLYGIWQQGALAGATAEQAYFVNIGLGKTMTQQDVLEGRMVVEIGIAAVRPAEFIVLKFSHKLQES
ncbi:phage tail sheath subtilisin-like domain-containing protein [Fulvivirga sp. 2943]|uniref:Phage tail sheath subtilisin-like domain-containing protein n=2 Tax=Fulvivirga sediminis TaxID=2803949 RepID=A0A937F747_9BACT|nr:phage tail sheath subtilisin-like domain-containing protein [Fulvivirga sediminis]